MSKKGYETGSRNVFKDIGVPNAEEHLIKAQLWDESARWLGYFDGELQLFENGTVTVLNAQLASEPMSLDTAVVFFGKNAQKFQTILNEDEEVFVLGLKPRSTYTIEVDDEEMTEGKTDAGGILPLKLPHKTQIGVRLRAAVAISPPKSVRDDGSSGADNPR